LEFERKRLYAVLEAIPVWVYLQAPDYSIRWGNSKFLQLFGDPQGRPCYKALQNRDSPCVPCPTFRVFETKSLQRWEYTGGGHTSIIYDNYFLDSDGSPLVLEMGIDITDLKEKEQKIRELNETLEHRVAERTAELAEANAKLSKAVNALWSEIELAKKIQTCLLPTAFDNIHPDFEITAKMLTADEVGGDFYEITTDRKGNLWLAIGDVSGHGVTPGLIMMMAQTIHATIIGNIDCNAHEIVVMTNDVLFRNVHGRLGEKHFMTLCTLKYLENGRFQHAGAHLSMIVYRQKTGECELIRTKGIYLNFKRDISKGTESAEFFMDYGDILILYTDGLTEAQNRDGNILDIYAFVKIVKKHICQEPEVMKEMIMADVLEWSGNVRADDMSLVIVKRKL
jgi:serine phosphatase RsbU (regulator of sigma subunit)